MPYNITIRGHDNQPIAVTTGSREQGTRQENLSVVPLREGATKNGYPFVGASISWVADGVRWAGTVLVYNRTAGRASKTKALETAMTANHNLKAEIDRLQAQINAGKTPQRSKV